MTECLSRYTLMRRFSGDLDARDANAVDAHLASCARCRRVLGELEESAALFAPRREERLAALMDRIREEEKEGAVWGRRRRRFVLSSAAAAALALIAVLFGWPTADPSPREADIRFKGALSVAIIAKRDARQFLVEEGATLQEHDALRFVVTADRPGYLAVFSVDGSGVVCSYYPESAPETEPSPLRLERGGRHELPGSVVLDEATGEEQLVVVFSPEPFDRAALVEQWLTARRTGQAPSIGKEMAAEVITIIKESHRDP